MLQPMQMQREIDKLEKLKLYKIVRMIYLGNSKVLRFKQVDDKPLNSQEKNPWKKLDIINGYFMEKTVVCQ